MIFSMMGQETGDLYIKVTS